MQDELPKIPEKTPEEIRNNAISLLWQMALRNPSDGSTLTREIAINILDRMMFKDSGKN